MAKKRSALKQATARSQLLDDLIQGTNSSSIVSKRSVERLYYPDEPHYFRYLVKKFQRRAPLINRGYWLRLRAIDVIVRRFLIRDSPRRKVVINLGCGSDVLPWQCHARYGAANDNVLFVDVDYPDLLRKKRAIVLETPQLRDLLGSSFVVSQSDDDCVLLRSDKYCQVACDLRKLDVFRSVLESFLDLAGCEFLFVAEVSITYMDTPSADALIQWASSIGQAEFCLLEQILPLGPQHPFAQTMLAHFDKLSTPPKSVGQYQTLKSQTNRFRTRGWTDVEIWDLWQAWEGDVFVDKAEKLALDEVEPFDEWEEFVLFCRHYFIIHARTEASGTNGTCASSEDAIPENTDHSKAPESRIQIMSQPVSKAPKRRFGNVTTVRNKLGQDHLLHVMGLDNNGRAATCDIFSCDGASLDAPVLPLKGPLPRVCFTMTDLGNLGVLLAGGRTSPTVSLSDCWLLERGITNRWVPMPALPAPLFRHSAIRLGISSLVLVAGGKTGPSEISGDYYLLCPGQGWRKCHMSGPPPEPSYGSVFCNSSDSMIQPGIFRGMLAGGLDKYGHFIKEKYWWTLDTAFAQPTISFTKIYPDARGKDVLSVFGANLVELGTTVALCGGVGADASLQGCSISTISVSNGSCQVIDSVHSNSGDQRIPFMVGSSAVKDGDDIIVVGGGATCFSMGTFWESSVSRIRLSIDGSNDPLDALPTFSTHPQVKLLESQKYLSINPNDSEAGEPPSTAKIALTEIRRVKLESADQFEEVLRIGKPVIIEALDLGQAVQKWTPTYMTEQVGPDRKVVVHECHGDSEKMDFTSKNFNYVTESFGDVMERVRSGARLYLRSLSHEKPSEMPAQIEDDFPSIAADFSLPPELDYVAKGKFSSVLRVSGRVNMWLHYDVMANVYSQIVGSKRLILFPPSDVKHLSFAPGASSSGLDVFSALDTSSPSLAGTRPHEAVLHSGDSLFLPALWLHTATPMTDMSVAVNVFFRDLDSNHYAGGRDVYGNKDLEAYDKGRQAAARIGKSFQQMPVEVRRFYLARIADELLQAAEAG